MKEEVKEEEEEEEEEYFAYRSKEDEGWKEFGWTEE